jgi:hypothetical protein
MPWWRFIPCGRHYRDPHRSSLKTVAEEDQNLHRVSHELMITGWMVLALQFWLLIASSPPLVVQEGFRKLRIVKNKDFGDSGVFARLLR